LPDRLDASAQRRQIESILDGRHAWDVFSRRSVVAPLLLKISDDKAGENRVGRRVDLWFVAYGELKSLSNDEFLTRQIGIANTESDSESGSSVKLLTTADVAKRGIVLSGGVDDPRFVATNSTLLDRVHLAVTTRNQKSTTAESVSIASILDDRFASDREFPNSWQAITRDNAGQRQLGAPRPYVGMGSYVKATRLREPAGALFVEYHLAFAEPKEWFQGTNLLRSKLPIVAQDAVRKYRRSLEER
jgi:hypothetical protein